MSQENVETHMDSRRRKRLHRATHPWKLLERTRDNAFNRAYFPALGRLFIVIALASGAIAAGVLEVKGVDHGAAKGVLIGAGVGLVLAALLALGLARAHKLDTQVVLCDKGKVLPRMNTAAAEGGYVIASQVGDYIRYEDIESPGVGTKGFTLPGLNVVVQFSGRVAAITGPQWIVEDLIDAALAADPTAKLEQDAHADS